MRIALTIAGSDSGGGAGIQADLKAFAAAGAHGSSVLVALTAQSTTAVTAVHELPPPFVRAQLDAVFDDIGVDAAKTGMLFSRELIETVADYLEEHPVPLVVDPVMVASSGAKLLQDDAVETMVRRLFPLAAVVTPNLPEAQALAGDETEDRGVLAERLVESADHRVEHIETQVKNAGGDGGLQADAALHLQELDLEVREFAFRAEQTSLVILILVSNQNAILNRPHAATAAMNSHHSPAFKRLTVE